MLFQVLQHAGRVGCSTVQGIDCDGYSCDVHGCPLEYDPLEAAPRHGMSIVL